jgi:endonuclease/exonuclease/phosphatase (EEP) superfamily protein YafD
MKMRPPWLKTFILAGIVLGVSLTVLGLLAQWWPALDIVNNGLPFVAAGTIVVFGLALLVRDWRFIVPATLLAAINVGLIFAGLQGATAEAAPDSKRFLRVVTFNLSFGNDRIEGVDKFLNETDADIVVLQEVTKDHLLTLHTGLDARYPYSRGEFGIVIFSKYPIRADGRVDRPGYPEWIRLMARWVEIDVNGTAVDLVGVHLARPFYPVLHEQDVTTLTQFVLTRKLPVIVAGDFNMTPWTDQLKRFTYVSGLGRFNTFHFTWPMARGNVPLLPLVAIDNVFASSHFAKIATIGARRLGSDHRAVIADIALAAQPGPVAGKQSGNIPLHRLPSSLNASR